MKIAIVCPASLPATQFGGIVFLAIDIAKKISDNGHEVNIYTTDLDFSNGADIFNKELPKREKINNFFINRTHSFFSVKLFFINPGIYFQLKKDKPDIIHTIGLRSFQSFIAWRVSKENKIPLISTDQGGLTTHPFIIESGKFFKIIYNLQNKIISKILKDSSVVCAANEYEKKIFYQLNKKSNISIIRNGINLQSLISHNNFKNKFQIDSNFMLFVGRFSKSKGLDILIDTVNILKDELVKLDFILVIMGVDFGYQKEMLEKIEQYKINSLVKIIINPSREDVISSYNESEFLILPSRWELSPLVPLESFAFKKPVISTNCHGIPFTIKNNENGILVEPENAKDLGDAVLKLIKNKSLRQELGENGYNFVHNECNIDVMGDKYLSIYKNAKKNYENKYS